MRILFQGDSITDCSRGNGLGMGYALLSSAAITKDGTAHECINRGVSGHRVVDLLARWRRECTNLKPDYMSILIGVNDVWHELNDNPNGVDAVLFEKVYDLILELTFQHCPAMTVVLMEPYLLHGPATDENWDVFNGEVSLRRAAVRRLAKKYNLNTIPLQDIFDDAIQNVAPASHWSSDGVHPTPAGHALIAEHWVAKFKELTENH